MVLCWWCCVWWGCVDYVVEMVLCRWCVWWCSVGGVVCMVLQVLRLPRKTSLRCAKCCPCHAKRGEAQKPHSSPDFRRPLWRCSKCCACHAKRTWGAPGAAPATQNEPEMLQVLRLPRKTRRRPKASLVAGLPPTSMKVLQVLRLPRKTRRRPKASLVARLLPTSMKVLQVLLLPRKTNLRCSKCCACHAKWAGDAATQNEAAPKSLTCCRTSADLYEGAPSAAPAM